MIENLFIFFFGKNYHGITYLVLLMAFSFCLIKKIIGLDSFSISNKGISFNFVKGDNEKPTSSPKETFRRLSFFKKKKLDSLPPNVFSYFCQNYIWQHIYLTPHDYEVFTKMMSPGEVTHRDDWIKNWNNQDFLDIDFRLIQKLVDQNKKDVEKLEARLARKK